MNEKRIVNDERKPIKTSYWGINDVILSLWFIYQNINLLFMAVGWTPACIQYSVRYAIWIIFHHQHGISGGVLCFFLFDSAAISVVHFTH